MDESPTSLIAYAALAVGIVLAVPYVVRTQASRVNAEALTAVLRKLFAARDIERAFKLTRAAQGAALCVAMHDALLAVREGVPVPDDAPGGYRTGAADSSPEAVLAHVRAGFDRGFERGMARVRRARWLALGAAPALALAVAAPWVLEPAPLGVAIAGAVVLVLVGFTARLEQRARHEGDRMFGALSERLYELTLAPNAPPRS